MSAVKIIDKLITVGIISDKNKKDAVIVTKGCMRGEETTLVPGREGILVEVPIDDVVTCCGCGKVVSDDYECDNCGNPGKCYGGCSHCMWDGEAHRITQETIKDLDKECRWRETESFIKDSQFPTDEKTSMLASIRTLKVEYEFIKRHAKYCCDEDPSESMREWCKTQRGTMFDEAVEDMEYLCDLVRSIRCHIHAQTRTLLMTRVYERGPWQPPQPSTTLKTWQLDPSQIYASKHVRKRIRKEDHILNPSDSEEEEEGESRPTKRKKHI